MLIGQGQLLIRNLLLDTLHLLEETYEAWTPQNGQGVDVGHVSDTGTRTTQLLACPIGVHSKKMFFLLTTWEGHGSDTGGTPIKKKSKKTRGTYGSASTWHDLHC